ncbi:MAG: transglutaminase family protein [Rhodospirillales bacterium]
MRARFAPGGLMHFGQGKWYPGEPLPRWALSVHWRKDGIPLWTREDLIADDEVKLPRTTADAGRLAGAIAGELGLSHELAIAAYEDTLLAAAQESLLPDNIEPASKAYEDPDDRARLLRTLGRLGEARGFVLPLAARETDGRNAQRWRSSAWPFRRKHLFLLAGDSPLGLRLPLSSLPHADPEPTDIDPPRDPFAQLPPLPAAAGAGAGAGAAKTRPRPRVLHK